MERRRFSIRSVRLRYRIDGNDTLGMMLRAETAELLKTTLLTVGALFPIVNPLGTAPIFLSLTKGYAPATRSLLARRIAVNGFILMVASILIGTYILAFFGISLPVVQVGGGMVVIATGWGLLHRKDEEREQTAAAVSQSAIAARAFYPLTLPLTVGPGTISVAITLGANRPDDAALRWPLLLATLIGPALVALGIYLSYRYAENVERVLGETAMNVFLRLSSFILLCIGVQILWNGIASLLRSVR